MLTRYMCVHLLLYFTHSLGRFLMTLNLHVQIGYFLLLIRYLERITRVTRSLEFSLFDYWYSYFVLFLSFPLIPYIWLNACFIPHSSICVIAVILIQHSDCIACSGYFRFSVYTWGILLAYIRRWLSLQLRFHVFREAGRDRVFLVSEPCST